MIHYSVLIPLGDSAGAVDRLLPQLDREFERLVLPYEIICIEDASGVQRGGRCAARVDDAAHLRVLRCDQRHGTSAALSLGIAASRGDIVIALSPDNPFRLCDLPQLIARLSEHDLVMAQTEASLGRFLWDGIANWGRLLFGRGNLGGGESFFWCARRTAIAGLALAPGAFRALAAIVVERGFRVCLLVLADGLPARGRSYQPAGALRWIAGWLNRPSRATAHRGEAAQRATAV